VSSALVHIGTPRTGTTAFQQWIAEYRDLLLSERGIYVYRDPWHESHISIALYCLRPERPHRMYEVLHIEDSDWRDTMRDHIRREVANPAEQLLVSSEDLSHLTHHDEVEQLVEILMPRDVRVAMCVRDPATFLESQRYVLQKLGLPAPDITPEQQRDLWETMIATWRSVLGTQQVVTFSYEQAIEEWKSTTPATLAALTIEPVGLPDISSIQTKSRRRSPYWRARRAFSKTHGAALLRKHIRHR
jgi:hypothetical protein